MLHSEKANYLKIQVLTVEKFKNAIWNHVNSNRYASGK